jgi:AcrR family transcriptional regulator
MGHLRVCSCQFRNRILILEQATEKTKSGSRSRATRARILAAAKTLFSSKGYERTTIRSVAAAADIHPSMVIRYFRSKERLFAAAVSFDLRLPPKITQTPKNKLGTALVHHFLERWEGQEAGDELPSLLRAAATHPEAEASGAYFRTTISAPREKTMLAEQIARMRSLSSKPNAWRCLHSLCSQIARCRASVA